MTTPWHPFVVHFGIVFSIVTPIVFACVWYRRWKSGCERTTWRIVWVVQLLSLLFNFGSVKTGENDERRMITHVPMQHVHAHGDAGTTSLWLAGTSFATMAAAGFVPGIAGTLCRAVSFVGSGGAAAYAVYAGKSGGELVYGHGAANPFVRENSRPEP